MVILFILILSMSVSGSGVTKTIEVTMISVPVKVGSNTLAADNLLYNGTTYVPLKAFAEALDAEVTWDEGAKSATVRTKMAKARSELEMMAEISSKTH